MKRIITVFIAMVLMLSLCACNRGPNHPGGTVSTDVPTGSSTSPDTEAQTDSVTGTGTAAAATEEETSAPAFSGEPYSLIVPSAIATSGSIGELRLNSDNTYTAEIVITSRELGVAAETRTVEYGTFESVDGVNCLCSASELFIRISFNSEADRIEAYDALDFLQSMKIIDYDYIYSYECACDDEGYRVTVEEAAYDPFLSAFISADATKILLDRESMTAYNVNVTYDLPDGQYRIEESECTLTLDANGKAGECTLEFALSGDNKDGLGTYSDITILKGTYVRNGSSVTCTITGELTKLKYDSEESQKQYIKSLEVDFAAGKIIEEVYNYNKSVASEEGRYLDYGDKPDEYVVFVIDVTHTAIFTSTPSQEYYE